MEEVLRIENNKDYSVVTSTKNQGGFKMKILQRCVLSVIGLLMCSQAFATHYGVEPIVGLPNYNGTYWGTPGTGNTTYDSLYASSPIFTTLYRDNYDRVTANCAGEGCGKHPAVDIRVPSGTSIKAVLAGEVTVSRCSATWGGLVIIEADNPYIAGQKVYIGYAHLQGNTLIGLGPISLNAEVGLSGGALSDNCPGTSTGAHLHFQIDRPHGGPYPWFPSGGVESPDSNFEVTQYTYNPLTFVQYIGYHWSFDESNNKELWSATNVNSFGVTSPNLWIDSSSTAPYAYRTNVFNDQVACISSDGYVCSREVTIEADLHKTLVFDLDFKCFSNPVVFYWRNNSSASWNWGTFNYDTPRLYGLGMGGASNWTGIITDILIQPSQGCIANPGPEEYFIKQVYTLP